MDDREMWEMWAMYDEVRLSPRERLVLLQIEKGLRQDRRFARRMGDAPGEVWLPVAVLLLGIASAFVAVVGVRTSDPALLCCFALLWPLTLVQALSLLCRALRHRTGSGNQVRPWL
ncbi:DUF3040 domain-containing protein [Streptomyces fodineus]|uniref:DUF3040 domain-containing protein n=1 Tax=Streptomyces fodineus TaxID=1904616 RepID=A0A1D7YKU4_9ACTN|nr:DUF3040 domain-containing protein [Streptomyces fodineus]AOR36166.1 DUF3040 domain-containing protein [Streptomyces fodineus]